MLRSVSPSARLMASRKIQLVKACREAPRFVVPRDMLTTLAERLQFFDGMKDCTGFGTQDIPVTLPAGLDSKIAHEFLRFVYNEGDYNPTGIAIHTPDALIWAQEQWRVANDFFGGPRHMDLPCSRFKSALAAVNPLLARASCRDGYNRSAVFVRKDVLEYEQLYKLYSYKHRSIDMDDYTDAPPCQPHKLGGPHVLLKDAGAVPKLKWGNLHKFLDSLNELDLPWYNGTSGVVVAGGSIVAALNGVVVENQDIDCFIVAPTAREAFAVLEDTIAALKRKHTYIRISLNNNVVDVQPCDKFEGQETGGAVYVVKAGGQLVQIITRYYPTPAHIIHGFDIDVCALMFDGCELSGTSNALRALTHGWNLYDQDKLSTTADLRYVKYMRRYGYKILVCGISSTSTDMLADRIKNQERSTSSPPTPPGVMNLLREMMRPSAKEASFKDYGKAKFSAVLTPYTESLLELILHERMMVSISDKYFTGAYNPVTVDMFAQVI